tara:strand:+ start:688 stop:1134 length:447 start_codon:yes stop_codon:yes gene_type:complete
MASTLKINTLTGVTTAGAIAVTGEGNSTTTNLQQGLAKAWSDYNAQADGTGNMTTADSFNISGLTDNGTGDYTHAYTNAMASANHVWTGCVQYETGAVGAVLWLSPKSGSASNRGASSVRVASVYDSDGSVTYYDYAQQQFVINGDLA